MYEPGWKGSSRVGSGPDDRCQVEHVGMVVSGCAIPPGHDSWVVGDEPSVSLHFLGAEHYAGE